MTRDPSVRLVVYTTTSCRTCGIAKKRLDAAGIPHETVNVEESPEAAERIKAAGYVQAPVFEIDGSFGTIVDLRDIIRELSSKTAVAA